MVGLPRFIPNASDLLNRRALFLPLAGMFFDLFDGKVARWRKEASMLGQELDSLADSVRYFPLNSAS